MKMQKLRDFGLAMILADPAARAVKIRGFIACSLLGLATAGSTNAGVMDNSVLLDGQGRHDVVALDEEREDLIAMGFDPADPVILNLYREEKNALATAKAVTAIGDFSVRTSWGSSGYTNDLYFSNFDGLKTAKLDNGNVVTLGRGRKGFLLGDMQFVLTQRNPAGEIVKWADVPSYYSDNDDEYIVYPNGREGLSPLRGVHDLKVYNNRIYVLTTAQYSTTAWVPLVRCFTTTGASCGWSSYLFMGSGDQDGVAFDIDGGQMAILARNGPGTTGGFRVVRYKVESSGSLTFVSERTFATPHGDNRAEPVAIAIKLSLLTYDGYFVLYTRKFSSDTNNKDYDPCLFAVAANDAPDNYFSGPSYFCRSFDEVDSSKEDRAISLKAQGWRDFTTMRWHISIDVAVHVARKYEDGIGVWRVLDGASDSDFGKIGGTAGTIARGLGRVVVGGCGPLSAGGSDVGLGCSTVPLVINQKGHYPSAIDRAGSDLIVLGMESRTWNEAGLGLRTLDSPLFVRLNSTSGKLEQITTVRHPSSAGD